MPVSGAADVGKQRETSDNQANADGDGAHDGREVEDQQEQERDRP